MSRQQLLELGYNAKAIEHRIAKRRLHRIWRGIYAVGRPELTPRGRWMAAVLSCGPEAFLSHESAAALWGVRRTTSRQIDVSVPYSVKRRRPGIVLRRRSALEPAEVTRHEAIPVTTPICTLIDLATVLNPGPLEAAINEADKRDLTDPEELRSILGELQPRPGVRALREILDRPTFALTDSELERRLLPIIRRASLPRPLTGCLVNGFRVDFFWPDLRLVVETDGLRYHRTPAQQAKDRRRDQAHTAAGLTCLRFTRAQVRFEAGDVEATLRAVAQRLRNSGHAD